MDAIAVFDQAISAATPCTTAWEEVGLSALRQALDDQAIAIAGNQESSLQSRKALATQAKSFRASLEKELGDTSETRGSGGTLVRAFKSEIDALTTRSRFAESAFLSLYKLLREAPDPAVAVQTLSQAARGAVEALQERNRILENQSQELTGQVEALRASASTPRGGSLSAEELQEERRALRAELATEQTEQEQLRLQALQDAVQEELLHAQRQAEHERAAGQAQLQVLQEEVERLEVRAALFEEEAGRAGRLEDEARAREEALGALRAQISSLESEREAMSGRAAAAVEYEDRAKVELAGAQNRLLTAEQVLGNRVKELEEERVRLRREIEMGADSVEVGAMREKIRILEGIWGDGADDDDGGGGGGGGGEDGDRPDEGGQDDEEVSWGDEDFESPRRWQGDNSTVRSGDVRAGREHNESAQGRSPGEKAVRSEEACTGRREGGGIRGGHERGRGTEESEERGDGLDAWLISYNARLRKELERLRARTREAEERLQGVEKERAAEAAELAEAQQDVKRLEQDLVDAHQVVEAGKTMLRAFQSGPVAKQFGKLVGRGAGRSGGFEMDLGAGGNAGGAGDVLEGMEVGGMEEGGLPAESEGFSAADRLLGAVKRQRERFRKEALRREREASVSKANAEQLSLANQELRRENVHLYKKIRFLMSYAEKGAGVEAGWGASTAAERSTEHKYEELYEGELDPFKEFDSQEKAARRGSMGLLERWLFWASGTVLRNRCRRYVLLVYLLVLHVLLFLTPGLGLGSTSNNGAQDARFGGVVVHDSDAALPP